MLDIFLKVIYGVERVRQLLFQGEVEVLNLLIMLMQLQKLIILVRRLIFHLLELHVLLSDLLVEAVGDLEQLTVLISAQLEPVHFSQERVLMTVLLFEREVLVTLGDQTENTFETVYLLLFLSEQLLQKLSLALELLLHLLEPLFVNADGILIRELLQLQSPH